MGFLPDESRVLRPPGLVNRNSVYVGWLGWASAMLQNAIANRPALKSDLQIRRTTPLLNATKRCAITSASTPSSSPRPISRYEDYTFAKRDREMRYYIGQHPELFPKTVKRTFAEIVEPFTPVR
ncbi:hypothetical protein CRUP_033516 [Coryphaenoides rupestris]|nr:hypothetical protein CRUP_033516 [Coryphaenoides rupestris]